jgi:hypothetical protein
VAFDNSMCPGSTQPLKMSTRIQGKNGLCVRLTTYHLQSGSLNLPEPSGPHRPVMEMLYLYLFSWLDSPQRAGASSLSRLHDHTQTHHVIGPSQRPLPDHAQHSRETDSHAPAGFELAIPASERLQTHAIDRTTTEIGIYFM